MICKNPKISLVAYSDRYPEFIFVAIPNRRGRYIRTDTSVALRPCRHCGAIVGEPCKGAQTDDGYSAITHVARRIGKRLTAQDTPPGDIVNKPRYRLVHG